MKLAFFLILISASFSSCTTTAPTESMKTFTQAVHPISLNYPTAFKQTQLTQTQIDQGYLLRIVTDSPSAIFTLRYEDKLGYLKILGGSIYQQLLENVNMFLPERYPGFKKEFFQEVILANEKAGIIDFTYTGNDKQTIMKQHFVFIVKGTRAYYLSGQSSAADFNKLTPFFDLIVKSFKFTD